MSCFADDVPDYEGPGPDDTDGEPLTDADRTDGELEDAAPAGPERVAPNQGGSSMPRVAPATSGKKR